MIRPFKLLSDTFPSATRVTLWFWKNVVRKPKNALRGGVLITLFLIVASFVFVIEIGYVSYNLKGPPPIYQRRAVTLACGGLNFSDYEYHMPETKHMPDGMSSLDDLLSPWYFDVKPFFSPIFILGSFFSFGKSRLDSGDGVIYFFSLPTWPFILFLMLPIYFWIRDARKSRRQRTPGFPVLHTKE